MTFQRRLFLYFIGLVLGGIVSYFIFGQRLFNTGWMPKDRIRLRLGTTLIKARPEAMGTLRSWDADLGTLRGRMPGADVILRETEHHGDSLFYHIDMDVKGHPAELVVLAFKNYRADTTATLWALNAR
ncbi:MAG: hypothetical protein H6597_08205 [Flavobacteriales bacterium]|nr:hypothetical protein [Flavobacteriales bacterium]MCB9194497.1 hypothetical protein [Flavobacteriales bacterium]